MKKIIVSFLILSFLIPLGHKAYAESLEYNVDVKDREVMEFAKEFIDKTYKSLKPMEFKDLSEKYLKQEESLFNKEMEIRNAVDHSTVRDFKDNGLEITLFKHEFNKVEVKEKIGNLYRVELCFDEIWEASESKYDSKDEERTPQGISRNVIVTVENDNKRLFITDLVGLNDGISLKLNKEALNLKPLIETSTKSKTKFSSKTEYYLNGLEPKGITPVKSEDESERVPKETIYNSERELKKAQIHNLENIKEQLTAPPKMRLEEDNSTKDISLRLKSYPLNHSKSGSWARAFYLVASDNFLKAKI